MTPIYYDDHAERYSDMSENERKDYPDELIRGAYCVPIKRVKKFAEMTKEDWETYGPDLIRLAAKDIPVSRGMLYH